MTAPAPAAPKRAFLTAKQVELLRVIVNTDAIDLDEILDAVRYDTSKQSLQFSLRALIKRGLIAKRGVEKRRGRQRTVIVATFEGRTYKAPDRAEVRNGIVIEGEPLAAVDLDLDFVTENDQIE